MNDSIKIQVLASIHLSSSSSLLQMPSNLNSCSNFLLASSSYIYNIFSLFPINLEALILYNSYIKTVSCKWLRSTGSSTYSKFIYFARTYSLKMDYYSLQYRRFFISHWMLPYSPAKIFERMGSFFKKLKGFRAGS